MSEHIIIVQAGQSRRLLTAGKYCDRDIVVTAQGGGGEDPLRIFLEGSITAIDSNADKIVDSGCRSLKNLASVNLPESIVIGSYAFYGCNALTYVNIPKATTVNSYAFYNCSSLEEISLPLASTIPTSCFSQCVKLKKLDLGAAASIGGNGLSYCTNLETIILRKTNGVATLNSTSLSNANFDGYVYVPKALLDGYKTAVNWATHADRIRAIEDYPEICGN